MMAKKNSKKAFTMAEAILVMTILGIIATIMITTIKPAQFKKQGFRTLAKKVLSSIDTATTQIVINDTKLGTFDSLIKSDGLSTEFKTDAAATLEYYKKYLTTIRTEVPTTSFCKTAGTAAALANVEAAYLKDGACIGIVATDSYANETGYVTIFPGEEAPGVTTKNITQGLILFDINGDEEPNTIGEDGFILPVGTGGIMYDG
ncbi:MAG: hypothetical protein IKU37_07090 [Candidatus Gastranaerophilales bacterium]|nr:hypothetical protein [Candidatus Gastranaerophilales bacterium]